jgi:protein-L-isoaspartate O-methyltransferase
MSLLFPVAASGFRTQYVPIVHEQDRDALFGPLTEQLLRKAGLRPGMRVLNIGCGAGEVACIASALVGTSGCVLGIERDARMAGRARARARSAGCDNVTVAVADSASYAPCAPFDALVGRCALGELRDPAAALRRLSARLRPGGIVAVQEVRLSPCEPLALSAVAALRQPPVEGLRWAEQAIDTGAQLFTLFLRAGLPAPHMLLGAWADVDLGRRDDERALLPALVGAWARLP